MCDLLLKNVEAAPTLNQTAKTIVDVFLKHVILRHGVPDKILTDQGPCFEASITAELCKCLGISKLRTSPYHPRTNGQVERFNRTFKQFVATGALSWEEQLPFALCAYNCSIPVSYTHLTLPTILLV